ncbi:MAG: DNA polymerase III subunit delta [Phycisphaerae bacterium]
MAPTVKPVYVLHGDDEHLRDERRREILKLAIGDADPQTCVSNYDSDAPLADVLDELRTLPFLAPHRVAIISQAEAFISANREGLEKYLESPSGNGTLVLMTSSWPSNTKLYKAVRKVGEAYDCGVPDKENLPAWISRAAQKRGKKIAPGAAELLGQWVGRDLAALVGEVEKLAIYVGDRPSISEDDVAALVTAAAGAGAFALTNSITDGDTAGALRALGGSITKRGEEFKVLGQIAWHLRRALAAKQALAAGASMERALPWLPYEQKNAFAAMLKRRSVGKLLGDFRRLIRADLGMKSGADPMAVMQELVVGLCR